MAKPVSVLTHATDLNFSSGPANGFPTKVSIPSATQGFIPGQDTIPEYLNDILNFIGTWIQWQFDGSSAGAADAHVVETDSGGDTTLESLAVTGRLRSASADGSITVGEGPLVASRYARRVGRIHSSAWHRRAEMALGPASSDVEDMTFAVSGGGPAIALSGVTGGGTRFRTASSANETSRMDQGVSLEVTASSRLVLEYTFSITSVLTNLEIEMGCTSVVGFPPSGNTVDGFSFRFFSGSDTFYTLVACDGSTVVTAAGSIAPVQGDNVRITLVGNSDGSAEMYVNGVQEATLPATSFDLNSFTPWVQIETLDATEKAFNLHRYEEWMDVAQAIP